MNPSNAAYRYPLLSRRSVIDCPVHHLTVALNDEGRVASACPECRREAVRARAKMRRKR